MYAQEQKGLGWERWIRQSRKSPSRIGPISLGTKQMGARSAGNPHAACDVAGAGNVARLGCLGLAGAPALDPTDEAGAGNVAWSRWCDTRRRKSEATGNTNFDLNRRVSLRPYL